MERIGTAYMPRGGLVLLAALALAGQAAAQDCVEPPSGMISWWPGDGDAVDVATGYDGAVLQGAGFAPGMVGDAFRFDGVGGGQDDQAMLSHLAVDGLADLTIEFWVNTIDDNGALVSGANGDDAGGNELLLYQGQGGLVAIVNAEGSGNLPASVNDGVWHHVALVREEETGRVYVDGVLVDERTYPLGSLDVGPRGFLLGQEQDCLAGCFQVDQALDGMLDEVTVYGRALSDTEVLAIFEAGSAGKCKPEMSGPVDEALVMRVEELEMDVDALVEQLMALEGRVEDLEEGAQTHEDDGKVCRREGHGKSKHEHGHQGWKDDWSWGHGSHP